MELLTLATAAYTFAQPFLKTTSEGIARKVGEDIWTLIKKPFTKQEIAQVEKLAIEDEKSFIEQLKNYLLEDPEFAKIVEEQVSNAQQLTNNSVNQNVVNNDKVEKQINASIINGNISL